MANEIVWFHSGETGAPTCNNVAGSLINVLDACLINGFNSKSVTSISVASGVATVTASAHGFMNGAMVDHAGATPSGLNGRKKITVTGSNTYTFDATGVANGSATGTLTAKRSPLGWTKQFSGTNKAVYARTDVAATAMVLRVDDTGAGIAAATYARARMAEAASDVDTLTNPAPAEAALSGGVYIGKGANSSTAKNWVLVGDSRTFYLFTETTGYTYATYGALHITQFGDISSYRAGDAYGCVLQGDQDGGSTNPWWGASWAAYSVAAVFQRPIAGVSSTPVPFGMVILANSVVPGGVSNPAYPSPVNNGMVIGDRALVTEQSTTFTYPIRGHMRGVKVPYANTQNALHLQVLNGFTGFTGELLYVSILSAGNTGGLLFDLTGPWD